jgi:hypothetical protein
MVIPVVVSGEVQKPGKIVFRTSGHSAGSDYVTRWIYRLRRCEEDFPDSTDTEAIIHR